MIYLLIFISMIISATGGLEVLHFLRLKYLLFFTIKQHKITVLWFIFLLLFNILMFLSLLLNNNQIQDLIFSSSNLCVLLILILIYYAYCYCFNKKQPSIKNFKTIDFGKMIQHYKLNINKNEIKKILKLKINKYIDLKDKYEILCEELTKSNNENFILFFEKIRYFNNYVSLFGFKKNKIIYKLCLYLFYDLQTICSKK